MVFTAWNMGVLYLGSLAVGVCFHEAGKAQRAKHHDEATVLELVLNMLAIVFMVANILLVLPFLVALVLWTLTLDVG